jgi:hypothetical protein
MRQLGQLLGIALAGDQGFDHPAARQAHDIGDGRIELDVGVFQGLLQALDMPAALPCQLLAGAQQVAHLLGLLIRHKATVDQAMGQQISQPSGVVDVGLAPRHVRNMCRVRQHQFAVSNGLSCTIEQPTSVPVAPRQRYQRIAPVSSLAGRQSRWRTRKEQGASN